jgi:hypothetical protein
MYDVYAYSCLPVCAFQTTLCVVARNMKIKQMCVTCVHAGACLCVPWVLSGAPQILESLCTAASGVLNTHVLMALAALGTLYMGMPQEVGVGLGVGVGVCVKAWVHGVPFCVACESLFLSAFMFFLFCTLTLLCTCRLSTYVLCLISTYVL